MSKRKGKLAAIAQERGETIATLVPRTVIEQGSVLAAAAYLGVAPNTLRYHLTRLGYKPTVRSSVVWELDETAEEKEDALETVHA